MYALHPQRDDFLRRVLDLPPDWMTPFDAVLFRFIHPQFSAAEEIVSGESGHWASGRWNLKGAMRVAYTAAEPETALAECLAHARYYNLPVRYCSATFVSEPGVAVDFRFGSPRC